MYPYNNNVDQELKSYTKEISRVVGIMSILFGLYIPLTGFLMGAVGLYYERKNARKNSDVYNFWNLALNAAGMIIGGLMTLYFLIFKLHLV